MANQTTHYNVGGGQYPTLAHTSLSRRGDLSQATEPYAVLCRVTEGPGKRAPPMLGFLTMSSSRPCFLTETASVEPWLFSQGIGRGLSTITSRLDSSRKNLELYLPHHTRGPSSSSCSRMGHDGLVSTPMRC